jgi:hypothetical protein
MALWGLMADSQKHMALHTSTARTGFSSMA